MRRTGAALTVVVAFSMTAVPAGAKDRPAAGMSISQMAGDTACIAQQGPTVCSSGRALLRASDVAVSPDGKNAYVAASGTPPTGFYSYIGGRTDYGSNAVSVLARDPETGAVSEGGCISADGGDGRRGSGGRCTDGSGLFGANDVAISPDGTNVYVVADRSHAVAIFARDQQTGALTQVGCIREFALESSCHDGRGLVGASGVAVSPDGKHVYVVSNRSNAVVAFAREAGTGVLTFAGCVSDDGSDGACAKGSGLAGANSVAVSPDGASVYVTASEWEVGGPQGADALTVFKRDASTGLLEQAGCFMTEPVGSACTATEGLAGATGVSAVGDDVYVSAASSITVAAFRRAPAGGLSANGCISFEAADEGIDEGTDDETTDDEAADAQADPCSATPVSGEYDERSTSDIAVAPDGERVYALLSGDDSAVVELRRDAQSGRLEYVECASSAGECARQATGLEDAFGLTVSPDSKNVYVAARGSNAVAAFRAGVAITSRTARVRGNRVRVRLRCPAAKRETCAGTVRLQMRARRATRVLGASSFRIRAGRVTTAFVRISRPGRKVLRRARPAQITAYATDARRLTRAARRMVVVRR